MPLLLTRLFQSKCEFIDSISRDRTPPICRLKLLVSELDDSDESAERAGGAEDAERRWWTRFMQVWFNHHAQNFKHGKRVRFLRVLHFNRTKKTCQLDRDFAATLDNPFVKNGVYILVFEGTMLWNVVESRNYVFISKRIGILVDQAARKAPKKACTSEMPDSAYDSTDTVDYTSETTVTLDFSAPVWECVVDEKQTLIRRK